MGNLGASSDLLASSDQPSVFRSSGAPLFRGSSVYLDRLPEGEDSWPETGWSYGLYGTPTTRELERRLAAMEQAQHAAIVPSGQAAIVLANLALACPGHQVFIPSRAYGPAKEFAREMLLERNVEVVFYDPGRLPGPLDRSRSGLIWCESPGSIFLHVQDIPAVARTARSAGFRVAADVSWAAGVLCPAFRLGTDVTVHSLTKYASGYGDVLLGSVCTNDAGLFRRIRETQRLLGLGASPDDCALVLRGLETLDVRLERSGARGLDLGVWLQDRPEVDRVNHPALEGCAGHTFWKRDFSGTSGLFPIELEEGWKRERSELFASALRLFRIAHGWGGPQSLIMFYHDVMRGDQRPPVTVLRISAVLENVADLIDDLDHAFHSSRNC